MVRFPSGQREQTVTLPRKFRRFESFSHHQFKTSISGMYQHRAGVAQLVERQPSKLHVASSTLVSRSIEAVVCSYSSVVEHSLGKGEVSSSNLDKSSRLQFSNFVAQDSKSRLFSLLFKYWVSIFLGKQVDAGFCSELCST